MATETTLAAIYGNDCEQQLTDNDLGPTPCDPLDYTDTWTGNELWRDFTPQELYDDPLLAVMLDAPVEIWGRR